MQLHRTELSNWSKRIERVQKRERDRQRESGGKRLEEKGFSEKKWIVWVKIYTRSLINSAQLQNTRPSILISPSLDPETQN